MEHVKLQKAFYFISVLIVVLFFFSCTEVIDIKLDSTDVRLVVDGKITTDTTIQFIKLTTSSSYFLNELPPVVSGANVKILYDNQEVALTETFQGSGIYATPDNFYGEKGVDYTLNISLNDPIGGRKDFQAVSVMPETQFSIDSIVLEYQPNWDFWAVNLYAWDPPSTDFYKIDAMRNGSILTDTAYRSNVTDDRFFNGNNTNGLMVMYLRANEVLPGDTITIILSSITKDYFEFFIELQTEAGHSNPLFSGPPANISSNVQPDGLGFFSTQSIVRASVVAKQK